MKKFLHIFCNNSDFAKKQIIYFIFFIFAEILLTTHNIFFSSSSKKSAQNKKCRQMFWYFETRNIALWRIRSRVQSYSAVNSSPIRIGRATHKTKPNGTISESHAPQRIGTSSAKTQLNASPTAGSLALLPIYHCFPFSCKGFRLECTST
jgi:hypothetical protein